MKYKLVFPFILLTIFLESCKEDHRIKLEKNGSADITYSLHFANKDTINNSVGDTTGIKSAKDSLYTIYNSFYKSPLISNYECKINDDMDVAVKYTISDVNQLGKFLSPFLSRPITCTHSKKTFTIDAGTGNADPEDDIGGYTNMLAFKITIELPGKIKSVENSSGLPTSYEGNQFTMESSVGMLNYSGKRNLVVIKY